MWSSPGHETGPDGQIQKVAHDRLQERISIRPETPPDSFHLRDPDGYELQLVNEKDAPRFVSAQDVIVSWASKESRQTASVSDYEIGQYQRVTRSVDCVDHQGRTGPEAVGSVGGRWRGGAQVHGPDGSVPAWSAVKR